MQMLLADMMVHPIDTPLQQAKVSRDRRSG